MSDKKETKQPNAIQRYVRETVGELRKVSWPTWPEARNLTIIVIFVMLLVGFYLAMIDLGASKIWDLVLGVG